MFYIQVSVKFKYFTHFNTLVTQFQIYVIAARLMIQIVKMNMYIANIP